MSYKDPIGNNPSLDRNGSISLMGIKRSLPPGVVSNGAFGHLYVEMGSLNWLTYDGMNYLDDYGKGPKIRDLYAKIQFWGEDPNQTGIYLKFKNGMKQKETAVNKFKYVINCPEPSFEKYIDDMGALVIDFYSVQEGLTIGTSKIIAKLYVKRHKQPGDMGPIIELRGCFPITTIGNNDVKIGEFNLSITSSFGNKTTPIPDSIQNLNNEDSFELNEKQAAEIALQAQNQNLHEQMNFDERVPGSKNKPAAHQAYNQNNFNDQNINERPTRDRNSNSNNLTAKNAQNSNFGNRNQINIDENENTFTDDGALAQLLQRGAKLQEQMAKAIDPANSPWDQIHGNNPISKNYVPPFLKQELTQMNDQNISPEEIRDKIYDFQIEYDDDPNEESIIPNANSQYVDQDRDHHREDLDESEANRRQIKDMKFIRVKIKTLRIDSDKLNSMIIEESFSLSVLIPLPDKYLKKISDQEIKLNNYDILSNCEYGFNSLSLYNFRVDEETLADYVQSQMKFRIPELEVHGSLNMNRLILSQDFKLETTVELLQDVKEYRQVMLPGKKRPTEVEEIHLVHAGQLVVEINLQSGDAEDEMKRNYQLKMKTLEEEKTQAEEQQQELLRQKMHFNMEQRPVFGQLYLHIEKLGYNDNIGERTSEQIQQAKEAATEEETRVRESYGFGSTLNNRLGTTDEEKPSGSENTLDRAVSSFHLPKRNLFVRFKAFPNLETLKTNTVWQKDDNSAFNYRSQFPVLMCPDTLEKMEKFILVLELWDQISPSVEEFLGIVKVPLAPICYSMKTTDNEIYSLNFMADQFCLYPMTICDGFLPVYSPKLGQNIAHLKLSLHMGSPVQVTRLIQKEQEEERRIAYDLELKNIREATLKTELDLKLARKAKKEKKRQLEEERILRETKAKEDAQQIINSNNPLSMFGGSPGKLQQLIGSTNSLNKADYDQRSQNMLNCMRKFFEEARTHRIQELNGEEIFKDDIRNFDGSVQKDDVIQCLLTEEKFSLTRIEVAQIVNLMLDINRDDQGRVDIDEIHFSYKSYIKYYELIEARIIDMLEKFKLSISKKLELDDVINDFVQEIENKAKDSKMSITELREIIEDRNGIVIRDAIYDQFMAFFDLDRDQQVYVTSLCEYLKTPSSKQINFFKVNSNVIANQIADYVKNSIETCKDSMVKLEDEFKQEIWKNHKLAEKEKKIKKKKDRGDDSDDINIEEPEDEVQMIPNDILINENINAKLFQFKLKRMGIALSLWEVFTLFETLNIKNAKMYFEPQRYHQLMFGNFYKFIKNQEYNRSTAQGPQHQRSKSNDRHSRNKSKDYAPKQTYDIEEHGYNKSGQIEDESEEQNSQEKGYWHKNEDSETEDPRAPYKQVKHIFEIKVKELKNIPVLNKFICQSQNQTEANANSNLDPRQTKIQKANANKYIQNVAVKYSFPLDEDEVLESDYLQLNKDALENQGVYNYQVSMDTVHTYILSKQDSLKKVLELCQNRGETTAQKDEYGQMLNSQQARREELFNMSIALFQDNREYIIGNAHLPIEDLIDTILQFENKSGTYDRKSKKTLLNRTLFLYGTTYSQRENCIIGKLQLEINYSQEKLFMSKREARLYKDQLENPNNNPYSCFMHRETYVNRKIPLNAKLSVLIDRVSHLKESIENIEHFHKIQHSAVGFDIDQQEDFDFDFEQKPLGQSLLNNKLSTSTMVHNSKNNQHLDRRRVLKHILKNGLNLICRCSVFEEDQSLVKKFEKMDSESYDNFGKYQTRMLFNSLNPVFGEVFEMNLQMDTKIFEYLKNKRAVFEVRHYIIESKKQKVNKMRSSQNGGGEDFNSRVFEDDEVSENTIVDEEVLDQCDFIILGFVRVPLLQLITKNNGVDGDFPIFDEFKQKMGNLRLRITLNHHNSQRPLYSTTGQIGSQAQSPNLHQNLKQTMIDQTININSQLRLGTITRSQVSKQKYILGLNFIELILKNRFSLTKEVQGQTQRFYLKFRIFNQNYQTKFIGGDVDQSLCPLNILLQKMKLQKFDILKTNFIELDMSDQNNVEQAFGKPLEIQLWHKVESMKTYEKPIKEEMLGQFFIELNELPKITNRRMKQHQTQNQPGKFQVYEGYFSLHESKRDVLSSDRLALRLYLFNKDETNETLSVDEMNQIFNLHRPKIEKHICEKLDPTGKGYADADDLIGAVKSQIPDEYLSQKLIWFIKSSLEYKSVDKIFYSPLFGLPPPFFKHAKKFDQLEIVCKFNEEIESLDENDNGFIPVNILKNVLEGELKIKAKIVDDFVQSLRDIDIETANAATNAKIVKEVQSLDVNMITNSLKTSHVDYIILIRKLSQFMDQNKATTNVATLTQNRIIDQIAEHEEAKEVTICFEIDNGMRIKNPISNYETPNSFVYMKPTFDYKEHGKFVQTSQIKSNSYPTWNYKSQNFTMPINTANREFLESGGHLEFEVFHRAVGASNNLNVEESNHLIGVAYIPLKGLIEGTGKTRLTGLYNIVPKGTVYNQSVTSMTTNGVNQDHGKIKVCVSTSLNIRKIMDGETDTSFSDLRQTNMAMSNNFLKYQEGVRNVSFGNEYTNNPYPSQKQRLRGNEESSPTKSLQSIAPVASNNDSNIEIDIETQEPQIQDIDASSRMYHNNLQNVTDKELDLMHLSNMSGLDDLTRKLKKSMAVLDVPEQQAISQIQQPNFAKTTYKTDLQRSVMTKSINDFRDRQREVDNPFSSVDVDTIRQMTGEVDEDDDLARPIASSLIQEQDSRLEETQQEYLPAFGYSNEYQDENEQNVFRESYDMKEMERIKKILKGDHK